MNEIECSLEYRKHTVCGGFPLALGFYPGITLPKSGLIRVLATPHTRGFARNSIEPIRNPLAGQF